MVLTDAQKVDIGLTPPEGIYLNVKAADYFAWPYLSKSALTKFCISPAQHRAVVDGVIKWPRSDALLLGSAVDTLWFDGQDAFDEAFACEPPTPPLKADGKPYKDWLGSKPGKAWAAEQRDAGRDVLSKALWTKARAMVAALDAHTGRDGHPAAGDYLRDCVSQVSLVYRCPKTKLWLKGRPDLVDFERLIVPDLKTARDVRPHGFSKAISEYDYHWQAYLYIRMLAALTDTDPWEWIAKYITVRSEPVHSVELYTLSASAREQGEQEVLERLREYRECAAAGVWPAQSGYERMIDLAGWRRRNG